MLLNFISDMSPLTCDEKLTGDRRVGHVSTPSNPDVNGVMNRLQAGYRFAVLSDSLSAELAPGAQSRQSFIDMQPQVQCL